MSDDDTRRQELCRRVEALSDQQARMVELFVGFLIQVPTEGLSEAELAAAWRDEYTAHLRTDIAH